MKIKQVQFSATLANSCKWEPDTFMNTDLNVDVCDTSAFVVCALNIHANGGLESHEERKEDEEGRRKRKTRRR